MTFLFDIGRVLLDFDFAPSLARLLPPQTHDLTERMAAVLESRDSFETGVVSAEEYIVSSLAALGSAATHEQFRHAWCHIFKLNAPIWEDVRALAAAGHRLILFSNTNALHCPWIFESFPDFDLFDEAVLSFEVGAIKPDPAIYQHAIDTHSLDPAATFYIDDLAANIAAGRAHGFHCFQYDLSDHAAFRDWLRQALPSRGDA